MDYVRGESQNRKDTKVVKHVQVISNKKVEEAPKWFDKEIEIQEDLDKSNEIQELINSL